MTQSTAMTTQNGGAVTAYSADWAANQVKLDLLKRTFADGTSNDEFSLFVEVAKSTGLNPFQRQIYAIMRSSWNPQTQQKEAKMTIQTGIDGYRLIAARTGLHAGTSDTEYGPLVNGYPEWARVTVKKIVGGIVTEWPATARWTEYAQMKDEYNGKVKTGRQVLSGQWPKMPYTMIAKCAEALALRRAFPAELSGIYTADEMNQAENHVSDQGRTIDTRTGEIISDTTAKYHPEARASDPLASFGGQDNQQPEKSVDQKAHELLQATIADIGKSVVGAKKVDKVAAYEAWKAKRGLTSVSQLKPIAKRDIALALKEDPTPYRDLVVAAMKTRLAADDDDIPPFASEPTITEAEEAAIIAKEMEEAAI